MALATFKDLCLDAADPVRLGEFWAGRSASSCTGRRRRRHLPDRPDATQHTIWVNRVPEPKTVKHRMHLDVNAGSVDGDRARSAPPCSTRDSFRWTLMADPEGGEFCVVRARGRDHPAALRDRHRHRRLRRGGAPDRRAGGPTCSAHGSSTTEHGYSYVDQIPGAPFDSLDFVAGAGAEDRQEPDPPRRARPRRRRPRRRRRDRAARPGRRDRLDGAGRPRRQRVLRLRRLSRRDDGRGARAPQRATATKSATTPPSRVAGVLLEEVAGVLDDRVRRARARRASTLLQHRRHRRR